ncbi:MAG TPA: hypothetical protein VFG20_14025 [Planctomycetaceae bacterium]|nr:hypothetical protein [Planctomycetaceae bacterium]
MNTQFRMYALAAEGLAAVFSFVQLPPAAKSDPPANQRPASTSSQAGSPAWYSSTGVREHLKLTDEQLTQLGEIRSQAWDRYQKALSELPEGLSADQRRLREQELLAVYHQELGAASEKLLTDPPTRQRYNQLDLQYRGYDAFTDSKLQKQLELSEQQRRRLEESNREWARQMAKYRRSYETDRDRTVQNFNQSRREIDEGIRSVLSPSQHRTYRELIGEPYDFTPETYLLQRDNLRRPGARTPGSIQ